VFGELAVMLIVSQGWHRGCAGCEVLCYPTLCCGVTRNVLSVELLVC
jgi:hypothetical protein